MTIRGEVSLTLDGNRAVVEIVDDGRADAGHSEEGNTSDSSGLRGLRERFQNLGGSCEAGSRPRGGFALTATIPVRGQ